MTSLAALRALGDPSPPSKTGLDKAADQGKNVFPASAQHAAPAAAAAGSTQAPQAPVERPDLVPMKEWLERREATRAAAQASWAREMETFADGARASLPHEPETSTSASTAPTAELLQPRQRTAGQGADSAVDYSQMADYVPRLNHLSQVYNISLTYAFKAMPSVTWAAELRLSGGPVGSQQVRLRDDMPCPGAEQARAEAQVEAQDREETLPGLPGLSSSTPGGQSAAPSYHIQTYPSKKAAKEAIARKAYEYISKLLPSTSSATGLASTAIPPNASTGQKRKAEAPPEDSIPAYKLSKPTPPSENAISLLNEFCQKRKTLKNVINEYEVGQANGAKLFGADVKLIETVANDAEGILGDLPRDGTDDAATPAAATGSTSRTRTFTTTEPHASKKSARAAAAQLAVSVLREHNKMPAPGTSILSPAEDAAHQEHKAAMIAKHTDQFTSGLKSALPKDTSYAQRAAQLGLLLNVGNVRYEIIPSKNDMTGSVWDCRASSAAFDLDLRAGDESGVREPGLLASVEGVFGKKQAKEAVARRVVEILEREKERREEIAGASVVLE